MYYSLILHLSLLNLNFICNKHMQKQFIYYLHSNSTQISLSDHTLQNYQFIQFNKLIFSKHLLIETLTQQNLLNQNIAHILNVHTKNIIPKNNTLSINQELSAQILTDCTTNLSIQRHILKSTVQADTEKLEIIFKGSIKKLASQVDSDSTQQSNNGRKNTKFQKIFYTVSNIKFNFLKTVTINFNGSYQYSLESIAWIDFPVLENIQFDQITAIGKLQPFHKTNFKHLRTIKISFSPFAGDIQKFIIYPASYLIDEKSFYRTKFYQAQTAQKRFPGSFPQMFEALQTIMLNKNLANLSSIYKSQLKFNMKMPFQILSRKRTDPCNYQRYKYDFMTTKITQQMKNKWNNN